MKHARPDYDRIQDPANLIPADEPVFLLRGQDVIAPDAVDFWANRAEEDGASSTIVDNARKQAAAMRFWQRHERSKLPDVPHQVKFVESPRKSLEERRVAALEKIADLLEKFATPMPGGPAFGVTVHGAVDVERG